MCKAEIPSNTPVFGFADVDSAFSFKLIDKLIKCSKELFSMFADVRKIASPRDFTVYAEIQNFHLLAELDFGGPKHEIR